ncbi:hypothetical protein [Fictibacillus fluitans]|uniref:Xylose isomerase-like TIM barrel domain-containing protein n=1 Tax=Fictibacillus fluitans TaxID=3058422 RepID=A0ABT8HZX3_9BACL|nr:hypothetical protein [Fictibacillus sp. NE201]MDN4526317.1 hypothetical protein [Fictibacillus sp. NE201]
MNHIYCTQNAFGNTGSISQEVEEIAVCLAVANADGMEVRRELLPSGISLEDAGERLKELNLDVVFSSPEPLFDENGKLNNNNLTCLLQEATAMGALLLKIPLGRYKGMKHELFSLKHLLSQFPAITFTVENDQTAYGGVTKHLEAFFLDCQDEEVPAGFTFDVGNPKYVGENPLAMFRKLEVFIRYIHVKHVINGMGGWKTVQVSPEPSAEIDWVIGHTPEDVPIAIEYPVDFLNVSQHVSRLRSERLRSCQEQVQ